MKNWLRNTLIAGGVLSGSLKGYSQNSPNIEDAVLKSLQGNWKAYEINSGIEQPKYCSKDSVVNFLDSAKWGNYEVHEGLEQPEYHSKDSVKNVELPSFKEIQKKLGIKHITEVKSLGHGYVTSKGEFARLGEEGNYETLIKLYGELSEEDLKKVDSNSDKIITSDEVFRSYASKQLGVSEDEIVFVGNGYVTSKGLEGRLKNLSDNYEKRFEQPRYEIYEHMGKDAVLTEDEISKTEEVIQKYL
jgi:hypothetical protein